MKKILCLSLMLLACSIYAQDRTLRLDYIFYGNDRSSGIALSELRSMDGWAGRRTNMDKVPLKGNGQICLKDGGGKVLYRQSFSSLFQEWQTTEEATLTDRAFENVFLVPMPSEKAEVCVELYDTHGRTVASLTHPVDPEDRKSVV